VLEGTDHWRKPSDQEMRFSWFGRAAADLVHEKHFIKK
jgi:hypothetical protein